MSSELEITIDVAQKLNELQAKKRKVMVEMIQELQQFMETYMKVLKDEQKKCLTEIQELKRENSQIKKEKQELKKGIKTDNGKDWKIGNKEVQKWHGHSQRILTVKLKTNEEDLDTFVVVYGPIEDEKAEIKNGFWKDLTLAIEQCRGRVYITGNFNGTVGNKNELYKRILGDDIRSKTENMERIRDKIERNSKKQPEEAEIEELTALEARNAIL
ncbi:hypothetical protein ILUMI_24247 [Ignelater luminosus]|uniref:Uncharacterized protein n=1 Tax=Ignelater luminosus TaxID=2038154 RepID=A0A8K0CCY7_IGNLU|nr:hypothetical protein ILUMI_24247 [Ignelater luminosus]